MVKNVFKIGGVLLVLYSLIVSLSTPLNKGIVDFQPLQLDTGSNAVSFRFFPAPNNPSDLRFFIKSNTAYFPIEGSVEGNTFSGKVILPDTMPNAYVDVAGQIGHGDVMAILDASFVKNITKGELQTDEPVWKDVEEAGMIFPFKTILYQTIRNLNLHVPMWFAMMAIMLWSLILSVKFLGSGNVEHDLRAKEAANVGLFFSLIGIATGAVWARFTWGNWWVADPKLEGAAVSTLIYLAYFVLRSSVKDYHKKARLAAVYNVFAFVMMLVFIQVLPRLTDSLHPGNGGNPAFSQYDLDSNLRKVFYPAVLGWILIGFWLSNVRGRLATLRFRIENED